MLPTQRELERNTDLRGKGARKARVGCTEEKKRGVNLLGKRRRREGASDRGTRRKPGGNAYGKNCSSIGTGG